MSVVLVTGATGFTGTYLIAELIEAGMEVVGLCQQLPDEKIKTVKYQVCDLLDYASILAVVKQIQPTFVVHLAAIAFVAHNDMEAIYRTNIMAARHLLAALATLAIPPDSILLASSANIYGNATVPIINENTPPAPANDYAVSKLAMEYMAHLWFEKLPIAIVRPFNYTGVGQRDSFLLPKMVKHFRQRIPVLELGNIEVERDFSDVRTVVKAYRRLLELRITQGVFNVCSGVGYSLNQVFDIMTKITRYSPEIRINPNFVRANEVKRLVGSKAFLESTIGLLQYYPLEETLRWMLEK